MNELNMERAGLTESFDALISGYTVPKGKPEPDIFLESARRMGCDSRDCYVIEDGENGILAVARAGCTPIMVPDLTAPREEFASLCKAVCLTLQDVIPIILEEDKNS